MIYRISGNLTLAVAFATLLPASAAAQASAAEDPTLVGPSISLMSGSIDGASSLPSSTRLGSGTAYGAALSQWATPWFGFRGRVLYSDQKFLGTNAPSLKERIQDGSGAWLLDADVLMRKAVPAGDVTLLPYGALGFGWKRYAVEEPFTDTSFHGGVGLELRYGRFGVFGEGDRVISDFDEASGLKETGEWLVTGGISVDLGS